MFKKLSSGKMNGAKNALFFFFREVLLTIFVQQNAWTL